MYSFSILHTPTPTTLHPTVEWTTAVVTVVTVVTVGTGLRTIRVTGTGTANDRFVRLSDAR
jgi:hypothetical protein